MVTGRSSCNCRPSGRDIVVSLGRAGGGTWRLDLVDGAGVRNEHLAGEDPGRLRERTVPVAPRHQVGEHEPLDLCPLRVVSGLATGEVDVGRVVVTFEVGRLAQ